MVVPLPFTPTAVLLKASPVPGKTRSQGMIVGSAYCQEYELATTAQENNGRALLWIGADDACLYVQDPSGHEVWADGAIGANSFTVNPHDNSLNTPCLVRWYAMAPD